MYDTDSESLWLQNSGESLEGEQLGSALTTLPEEDWGIVAWGDWVKAHPETLILTCAHCEGRGEMKGTIDQMRSEESTDGEIP